MKILSKVLIVVCAILNFSLILSFYVNLNHHLLLSQGSRRLITLSIFFAGHQCYPFFSILQFQDIFIIVSLPCVWTSLGLQVKVGLQEELLWHKRCSISIDWLSDWPKDKIKARFCYRRHFVMFICPSAVHHFSIRERFYSLNALLLLLMLYSYSNKSSLTNQSIKVLRYH